MPYLLNIPFLKFPIAGIVAAQGRTNFPFQKNINVSIDSTDEFEITSTEPHRDIKGKIVALLYCSKKDFTVAVFEDYYYLSINYGKIWRNIEN